MRFKAKIATTQALPSNTGKYRTHTSTNYFTFSKGRIFYEDKAKDELYGIFLKEGYFVSSGSHYALVRLSKHENPESWTRDSKFQIEFNNGVKFNLIPNWRNGIVLRLLHKRYWLLKNGDWFLKAVIPILFGAIVGVVINNIAYSKGYQNGLEAGKLLRQSQSTGMSIDTRPNSSPFFRPDSIK